MRVLSSAISVAACFLLSLVSAHGTVALSPFFADHMVLQRDGPIKIYGTAAAGETVSVGLNGKLATTITDSMGNWSVTLPAQSVGGPYTMAVTGTGNTVTLSDVLLGDVWLAVGQSNLFFKMNRFSDESPGVLDYQNEIAAANYPHLRVFSSTILAPVAEAPAMEGAWNVCSPSTAGLYSAVAYYFARKLHVELNVPIGIVVSNMGGTYVESWMDSATLHGLGIATGIAGNHAPGNCFNGMVGPLTRVSLKGFVYYQGESSTQVAGQYASRLRNLITGWRTRWQNTNMPFYYVQLANFDPTLGSLTGCSYSGSYGKLRLAQSAALGLPFTGMASAVDLGDAYHLHFRDKKRVGERVANLALAGVYGKRLVTTGPTFAGMQIKGGSVIVHYVAASLGSGLVNSGGDFLPGFEVSGADGVYYPAEASISGRTSVVVSCVSVPEPYDIRYAWGNDPRVTLHNVEGLPALPFLTSAVPPDGRAYPIGDPTTECQDGSEGHWQFEGDGLDRSGNGRALTFSSPPTFSADAKEGRASIVFNGTDQYGDAYPYDFGSKFTISCWVKLAPGRTGAQTIISNSGTGNVSGFRLYINSQGNSDKRYIFETGNGTYFLRATTVVNAAVEGEWQYVAVAVDRNAGTARFLIDNLDRTESALTRSDYFTFGDIRVGCMGNAGFYFGGSLDDLRITPATLTPAEICSQSIRGLIARWSFELNGCDASGNGHFATLINNATYSPAPAADGNYSAILDGRKWYIDAGNPDPGSACTVSLWVKTPPDLTGPYALVSSAEAGAFNGFRFQLNGNGAANGQLAFATGDGSKNAALATASAVFEPGRWNHVAVTFDLKMGKAFIYYRGVSMPLIGRILQDFPTNGSLLFGAAPGGAHFLKGNLDDVRLYNRALTASEISAIAAVAPAN